MFWCRFTIAPARLRMPERNSEQRSHGASDYRVALASKGEAMGEGGTTAVDGAAGEGRGGCLAGCGAVVAGLLLTLVALVGFGCGFDNLVNYRDVPSLVVEGGLILSGWLVSPGFGGIFRSLRVLLCGSARTATEAREAEVFCSGGVLFACIGGVMCCTIGLTNMLSMGMADPAVLTNGTAVALIMNLYACFAAAALYGLSYRARRIARGCGPLPEGTPAGRWPGLLAGAAVAVFVILFLGIGPENVPNFIYELPLIAVFGALLVGWLIAPGAGSWSGAVRVLWRNRIADEADQRAAQAAFTGCRLGLQVVLVGGAAGAYAGAVQMLRWGGTLPAGLTSGMALLMLSLFWMTLTALPLAALQGRARLLLGAQAPQEPQAGASWAAILSAAGAFFALLGMLILLATMGSYMQPATKEVLAQVWTGPVPYGDWQPLGVILGVMAGGVLLAGRPLLRTLAAAGPWLALAGGALGALIRMIDLLGDGGRVNSLTDLLRELSGAATPFFWTLALLVPLLALRARLCCGSDVKE